MQGHTTDLGAKPRLEPGSLNAKSRAYSISIYFMGVSSKSKFPEAGAHAFQSYHRHHRRQLCLDVSYYAPDAGLKTFHSGTHSLLVRPREMDMVVPTSTKQRSQYCSPDKVLSAV